MIGDRGHQVAIVGLGSTDEMRAFVGPSTRVISLDGAFASPGFIEGHGHFMGLGNAKTILDAARPATWDELVARVGEAAADAEPGEWIRGRGWHQEKWTEPPSGGTSPTIM